MDSNAGRALRLYTKIAGRCFGRWKRGKLGPGAVQSETKMKKNTTHEKKTEPPQMGIALKEAGGGRLGGVGERPSKNVLCLVSV